MLSLDSTTGGPCIPPSRRSLRQSTGSQPRGSLPADRSYHEGEVDLLDRTAEDTRRPSETKVFRGCRGSSVYLRGAGATLFLLAASCLQSPPNATKESVAPSPMGRSTWVRTGDLPSFRNDPAIAFLSDHDVLVVGGYRTAEDLSESFLVDLNDERVRPGPPTGEARHYHSAVPLPSGNIAFFGGTIGRNSLEIFRIPERAWSPVQPAPFEGEGYNLSVLPGLGFLAAGGGAAEGKGATAAWIFMEKNAEWKRAAPLSTGRFGHSMTTLGDGRVLAAGGHTWRKEILRHIHTETRATETCEIYDATLDRWQVMAPLHVRRSQHAAVLLGTGEVLVAGGWREGRSWTDTCELYDPRSNRWTLLGRMPSPRAGFQFHALPDGDALLIGGFDIAENGDPWITSPVSPRETFIFRSPLRAWASGPPLVVPRSGFSMATHPRGILVVGGFGRAALTSMEFLKLEPR